MGHSPTLSNFVQCSPGHGNLHDQGRKWPIFGPDCEQGRKWFPPGPKMAHFRPWLRTGPKMTLNRAENGHFRPCSEPFSALFGHFRPWSRPFSALFTIRAKNRLASRNTPKKWPQNTFFTIFRIWALKIERNVAFMMLIESSSMREIKW